MPVKRDYGSLSKASTRILLPLIEPLGYRAWYGGGFGRERTGWVDGFFLQQSRFGTGRFYVNLGIHIPGIEELRQPDQSKRSFGLMIAWRLSDDATEHDAERSYAADDKVRLTESFKAVAVSLGKAEPWFRQFESLSDVAEQYRIRSALPDKPAESMHEVRALNLGLLYYLNDSRAKAMEWLGHVAERILRPKYWDSATRSISYQSRPGLKIMPPNKDDDERLNLARSAMKRLGS